MEFYGVRLLVKDFDECFRFYTEKMGLAVNWGAIGDVYANFQIGKFPALSIFKSDLMAEAIGNEKQVLPENNREKVMFVIGVDDVDETYKELLAKGVEFVKEPTDMGGWGARTAHLRDTEGNLIELFSELPAEKWDKDLLDDMKKYEHKE